LTLGSGLEVPQAAIIGSTKKMTLQRLYSVELQPDVRIRLLETYTYSSTVVFLLGNGYIGLRERLTDPDRHSVDVARIEQGHLVPFQSLELVEYEETPIPASRLTLSNNGDLLAFTSWFQTGPEGSQIHLLVTDFEAGKTSLIVKVVSLIGQVTWSPDDTLIAAQICDGPRSTLGAALRFFHWMAQLFQSIQDFPKTGIRCGVLSNRKVRRYL
jgi:hypothetical protein